MTRNHLAGVDVGRFMRRHWQRRPLLLRGAFGRFEDPLSPAQVLALAGSDAASSRLVQRIGKRWTLEHGPFPSSRFKQLPHRDWTVLVQDTNHFAPRAARLLERFDFIPHARIDDVMVSYATPGGGLRPAAGRVSVAVGDRRHSAAARRRWPARRRGWSEGSPAAAARG